MLALIVLVWQAARVVAIAKAQARRREAAGKGDGDKGSGMVYSTYIKWQLVN